MKEIGILVRKIRIIKPFKGDQSENELQNFREDRTSFFAQ